MDQSLSVSQNAGKSFLLMSEHFLITFSISLLSALYDFGLTGGGTVNIRAGSVSLLINLILIVIGIVSHFMRPNKDTGSSSSIPNLREKSLLVVVIVQRWHH